MCVEEGGDGKTIGGGVSSIIHQLLFQTALPIYLSLQGAERIHFFLLLSNSAALLMLRSPSFTAPSLSCSVLGIDEGKCAARNPVHQSIQHWQGWWAVQWVMPLGGSTPESPRRADLRSTRMRQAVGTTSQKVSVDRWENSCFELPILRATESWCCFEFCFVLYKSGC